MEQQLKNYERIFVAGTDTGVGKTVLSLLLMRYFFEAGKTPFYFKPIQTGCRDPYEEGSDAAFIYQYVRPLKQKNPAESVQYCFKKPRAPWFAARHEKNNIDLKNILEKIEEKNITHQPVIIEGAGGILAPVDEKRLMIDLVRMINAGVIIAARAGLGTINHTLLTIEALAGRDIYPVCVILIDNGEKKIPDDMLKENIEAIEKFSGVTVAGVVGRIKDFSQSCKASFKLFNHLFLL